MPKALLCCFLPFNDGIQGKQAESVPVSLLEFIVYVGRKLQPFLFPAQKHRKTEKKFPTWKAAEKSAMSYNRREAAVKASQMSLTQDA